MLPGIMQLLLLGLLGWFLFKSLHLPIPAFLGPITVIGALRAANYDLIEAPAQLLFVAQVILGLFMGSNITRETICRLKEMMFPALIIAFWSLGMIFLLGALLNEVTFMDKFTAMLSSSIGGMEEMTVLALATGADVAVVTVMQTTRLMVTLIAVPLIIKAYKKNHCANKKAKKTERELDTGAFRQNINIASYYKAKFHYFGTHVFNNKQEVIIILQKILPVLAVALMGGLLLDRLGIPAGAMVGSMFSITAFSLFIRNVKTPPNLILYLVQVGLGIMVANNISSETVQTIISGELAIPIAIATSAIFLSYFFVAYLISKQLGWGLPVSLLAAAPAGFTVMFILAAELREDPFKVMMLHLCRVLVIKAVIPFVFYFL